MRAAVSFMAAATPRRRVAWVAALVAALVVVPMVLGITAVARGSDVSEAFPANGPLAWMNIRDSTGLALSDYLFATKSVSMWRPLDTPIVYVLGLEFTGYMILVTFAIWLIGYALSFRWLDFLSKALNGIADGLVRELATTEVLLTAAAIGAVFVGWFVVRGLHAKAAVQIVTMLGVGVLGPLFLAQPLADVLSSDGLLAQGRNVGIVVAAGLNGNANPNPDTLIDALRGHLADNFARKPVQVWNFGHVVDDASGCGEAWSASVRTGDAKKVKNAMKSCGDGTAAARAGDATMPQIGMGFVLAICAYILLAFGAYLAFKVIYTALEAIYHCFMAIFGFAAGGFVYGPSQTFLVRNLVDTIVAACRMVAFTIFLGLYTLLLDNVFRQAEGQLLAVFVIAPILEIAAIIQLRRLNASLDRGTDWMSNRMGLALQGAGAAGGGGGGRALGMGAEGATRSLNLGLLPTLAAASTISGSPLTAWLAGGVSDALQPQARKKKKITDNNAVISDEQLGVWKGGQFGGGRGIYRRSFLTHVQLADAAREGLAGVARSGLRVRTGLNSYMGAAAAAQTAIRKGGADVKDLRSALVGAHFTDEPVMRSVIGSISLAKDNSQESLLANKHLGLTIASMKRAEASALKISDGNGDVVETAADFAVLGTMGYAYRQHHATPITLPAAHEQMVNRYLANPRANGRAFVEELQNVVDGKRISLIRGVRPQEAHRILARIRTDHAFRTDDAIHKLMNDPANPQHLRDVRKELSDAANTERWIAGESVTPWSSNSPPGTHAFPADYRRRMGAVAQELRTRGQ
ncbi:MAG: hypothetical protein HOQ24_06115 [Mycobacteriaceae bacterium]|nr:hypothetical protein [Mycobacteriaceae bacterium]